MCIAINSSGWLIYAKDYLLLYPKIACTGDDKINCGRDYICNTATGMHENWVINGDSTITLRNWVHKYDLYCGTISEMNGPATAFYGGLLLGALFLPYLSDKHGRKRFFLGALLL